MWFKFVLFCVFGCSYTLTASVTLDGVLSGNSMAGVPLGRSLGDGELDVEGICSEPGVACQNCTHAVTCILLPVGYLKVPLQQCGEGQTCNAHLGKCTDQHVPECEEVSQKYEHTCEQNYICVLPPTSPTRGASCSLCILPTLATEQWRCIQIQNGVAKCHRPVMCSSVTGSRSYVLRSPIRLPSVVGIFPDAHDCRKFHLCSPPDGVPFGRPADHRTAFCPKHYGYNPQTAQCSIKLSKGQCSSKMVPECKEVGQNGVLPASPNHYYVCLLKKGSFYPQVFLCPHGWIFSNGFCRPEFPAIQKEPERGIQVKETKVENDSKSEDAEGKSKEEDDTPIKTLKVEEKPTTSRMDSFFSTDKPSTFAPDAFLADKFDLTNYESTDDVASPDNNNYDFGVNSFENFKDFW